MWTAALARRLHDEWLANPLPCKEPIASLSLQYDTCMFFLWWEIKQSGIDCWCVVSFLNKRKPLRIEKQTQTGRSMPLCTFSFFIRNSSDFVFFWRLFNSKVFSLGGNFFKYCYISRNEISSFFLFSSFFPWKRKKDYYYAMPDIHKAIMLLRVGRSTAGILHSLAGMCRIGFNGPKRNENPSWLTTII